jgi:hypothetical protein
VDRVFLDSKLQGRSGGDDAAALRPLVPVVCLVFCVTCDFFLIPPATSGGYSQRRQDSCLE